jgi:hypothetical protein
MVIFEQLEYGNGSCTFEYAAVIARTKAAGISFKGNVVDL